MKLFIVLTAAALAGLLVGGIIFRPVLPFSFFQTRATVVRQSLPVRLVIPSINVDTPIEPVALDSRGNMAVPKNIFGVGWYSLGVRPGEIGQAVLDGHLDTPDLKPSVFWNLKNLRPGDLITVKKEDGQYLQFRVDRTVVESTAQFPVKEIFGPAENARLNLITCAGVWDKNLGTFNQRVVVFSSLSN